MQCAVYSKRRVMRLRKTQFTALFLNIKTLVFLSTSLFIPSCVTKIKSEFLPFETSFLPIIINNQNLEKQYVALLSWKHLPLIYLKVCYYCYFIHNFRVLNLKVVEKVFPNIWLILYYLPIYNHTKSCYILFISSIK